MAFALLILFVLASLVGGNMLCPATEESIVEMFGNISKQLDHLAHSTPYLETEFQRLNDGVKEISGKLDAILPAWVQKISAWVALLVWLFGPLLARAGAALQVLAKWAKGYLTRSAEDRAYLSYGFAATIAFFDKCADPFKFQHTSERLLARATDAEMAREAVTRERDEAQIQSEQLRNERDDANRERDDANSERDDADRKLKVSNNKLEEANKHRVKVRDQEETIKKLKAELAAAREEQQGTKTEMLGVRKALDGVQVKQRETENELAEVKGRLEEAEGRLRDVGAEGERNEAEGGQTAQEGGQTDE